MKRHILLGASILFAACGGGSAPPPEHEMIDIPEGLAVIGADDDSHADAPAKTARMPAFKIGKFEVTNEQYRSCVQAGVCTEPSQEGFDVIPDYYSGRDYDNYPVTYVDWYQASDYCAWVEMRLPTEAEWEYAARGEEGYIYPWGDDEPDCSFAQYGDCVVEETGLLTPREVGALPAGASPFGVMDMAGNMAEWVDDWYDSRAYELWEDGEEPASPEGGTFKSIRGGSWWCDTDRLLSYAREPTTPLYRAGNIGFRCVSSE